MAIQDIPYRQVDTSPPLFFGLKEFIIPMGCLILVFLTLGGIEYLYNNQYDTQDDVLKYQSEPAGDASRG